MPYIWSGEAKRGFRETTGPPPPQKSKIQILGKNSIKISTFYLLESRVWASKTKPKIYTHILYPSSSPICDGSRGIRASRWEFFRRTIQKRKFTIFKNSFPLWCFKRLQTFFFPEYVLCIIQEKQVLRIISQVYELIE